MALYSTQVACCIIKRSLPSTPRTEEHDEASGKCVTTQLSARSSAQAISTSKLKRKLSKPTPLNILAKPVNQNESEGLDPLLSPAAHTRIGPQQSSSVTPAMFAQSVGWPLDRARSCSYFMRQPDQGGNAPVKLDAPESEGTSSYRDDILEDYGLNINPFPQPNGTFPADGSLPPRTGSSLGFPSSPKSHNSRTQSLRSKLSVLGDAMVKLPIFVITI